MVAIITTTMSIPFRVRTAGNNGVPINLPSGSHRNSQMIAAYDRVGVFAAWDGPSRIVFQRWQVLV